MDVFAILLDDVVHRGRVPIASIGALLLGEVGVEFVLARIGASLLVDVPGVGLVAAPYDAEMAGDVVLLGIRGDDRETIDLTLVGHSLLPQSTLDKRP